MPPVEMWKVTFGYTDPEGVPQTETRFFDKRKDADTFRDEVLAGDYYTGTRTSDPVIERNVQQQTQSTG